MNLELRRKLFHIFSVLLWLLPLFFTSKAFTFTIVSFGDPFKSFAGF
jgi:VIT1/CCC1 family predicted Fe2+/Mn2+ transporter